MPYNSVSDVPDYVPQSARPQWLEVFNSVYERTKGGSKEKEKHAFAAANGVAIKSLGVQLMRKSLDLLKVDGDAGWYGVDFDNTLVNWDTGTPNMDVVRLVTALLAAGKEVRVLTARVASVFPESVRSFQRLVVQQWCLDNIGVVLIVTAEKDPAMLMLYDDRVTPVLGGRIIELPEDHVGGMAVPKGGSCCEKCEYLNNDKVTCKSQRFILWNGGSNIIPGQIDAYCSDWFEPKD